MIDLASQHDSAPSGYNKSHRFPIWIALAIAVAMVGIYHEQRDVGEGEGDYVLATDRVVEQDSSDGRVQVGNLQEKVSFAALLLIGAYLAFVTRPERGWRPNRLAWVVAVCFGWAALSFFWSTEPSITLRELIRLSAVALVAFGIARNYTANQAMFIALVVCSASVLTALASELAAGCLTPWIYGYRLRGGMHANMVALHAAIMAIAAVGCLRVSKRTSVLCLLIAIALAALLLTKSRSGAATFLVGVTMLWSLRLDPRRMAAFWSSLVTVSAVVVLALAIGGSQWQRSFGGAAAMGRNDDVGSLTGRLPLWNLLTDYIQQRPLQGFGYEAFWTGKRRLDVGDEVVWYPTDAHSIYINTMLELGLIGTLLLSTMAITALVVLTKAYRETACTGYAFFATLVGIAFFHGLAEVGCSAPRIAGLCIGSGVFVATGWRSTVDQPVRQAAREQEVASRSDHSADLLLGGSP
ncbi:MAG: O-antigen ligase family protein [Aeoliella sp.]